MKLRLQRDASTALSTHGILYINGQRECHTLEDVVRAPHIKLTGNTAIAAGHYKVLLTYSPRFKRVLPLILDVPDFTGVRIHGGNTPRDTTGCILVGDTYTRDLLGSSQVALSRLIVKMQHKAEVTIDIVDA